MCVCRGDDRGRVISVTGRWTKVVVVHVFAVKKTSAGFRRKTLEEGKLLALVSTIEEKDRRDEDKEGGSANRTGYDVALRCRGVGNSVSGQRGRDGGEDLIPSVRNV